MRRNMCTIYMCITVRRAQIPYKPVKSILARARSSTRDKHHIVLNIFRFRFVVYVEVYLNGGDVNCRFVVIIFFFLLL